MKLSIRKEGPLSIREQIKRQIRVMIENGGIKPGEALPSARELAVILGVNRNTVSMAYKELAADGFLSVSVGSGTFVKKDLSLKSRSVLDQLFDRTVLEAGQLGFKKNEIVEHFMNRLYSLSDDCTEKRVLVVECNQEVIMYLCGKLKSILGVIAEGALIQDLESGLAEPVKRMNNADMIVCGFNHMEELRRIFPLRDKDIAAVLLHMDARIINMISQLPEGTQVGYVCTNQRSADTFYNSAYFSGGRVLKRIIAGYDNKEKLKLVTEDCDIVFATSFVYDRMKILMKPDRKLVNIQISLEPSSIDMIRERLSR